MCKGNCVCGRNGEGTCGRASEASSNSIERLLEALDETVADDLRMARYGVGYGLTEMMLDVGNDILKVDVVGTGIGIRLDDLSREDVSSD